MKHHPKIGIIGGSGLYQMDSLENIGEYGNSFGQSERMRAKWTSELDFKIKDVRKEEAEYLWFVGDYASYHPRVKNVTIALAKLFHKLGIDFGILGPDEYSDGDSQRLAGERGLFEMLAEKNAKMLSRCEFKEIITTDTVPISDEDKQKLGDKLTIRSIAPLLGEVILRAHQGRSVGEMFNE